MENIKLFNNEIKSKNIDISIKEINKIYNYISSIVPLYKGTIKERNYENIDISLVVINLCKSIEITTPLSIMLKNMFNDTRNDIIKLPGLKFCKEMELLIYLKCFKLLGITLDELKNTCFVEGNIFHYAIISEYNEILIWLFQQGFTINDVNYKTLNYLCFNNKIDILKWLLFDRDLPLNIVKQNNNSVLCITCTKGNLEIIKMLVKKGLNLHDIRCRKNFCLRYAAAHGHLEVVKYLISQGLTLNDIRARKNFALRYSAFKRHIKVFEYLIKRGLTFDDITDKNFEIYHEAWCSNNQEIIQIIEEHCPYVADDYNDIIYSNNIYN